MNSRDVNTNTAHYYSSAFPSGFRGSEEAFRLKFSHANYNATRIIKYDNIALDMLMRMILIKLYVLK